MPSKLVNYLELYMSVQYANDLNKQFRTVVSNFYNSLVFILCFVCMIICFHYGIHSRYNLFKEIVIPKAFCYICSEIKKKFRKWNCT